MSTLIEISGNDIAELGDSDFRDLIGRLCEADYRLAGLPTPGITWGGDQDAADDGLDVVVRGKVSPPVTSFIPRNLAGFQVKTSDMPRSAIFKEMRPRGVLRKSIRTLLQDKGAYIIVSSSGSTSAPALENRINAMKEAVTDETGHKNLHLDFFDRGRIATWVRSHPSMILWVREKIGKPLIGWQSYGNWAHAPKGIDEEYILDNGLRLHSVTDNTECSLSVIDGLSKLRSALTIPGICVRLVGLSGVGKTRLVQALFDSRVGENSLNQSQAIYADISNNLIPDPVTIAEQLINDGSRTILVIDNCSPDLHRRLMQTCSCQQSPVSLLTIEYDVREDIPEETRVFRLEPASKEVIERLISIRQQFDHISQVDIRAIARFSGGNARVAIALASTVRFGETLSGFRDEQLFERLFRQRHESNSNLLISAQVCSLVYSFEGTDINSETSEMKFLASLANKSSADIYHDIAELEGRGLIQSRGVWRAVLPHAIANKLAKRALETIPKDTIVKGVTENSKRVIRSFSRRLGYLHDCDAAIDIVHDWLTPDGWVGNSIDRLNGVGIDVLSNIAPVSPSKTLEAIERVAEGDNGELFTSRSNRHSGEFVRLLWHIAYDPELFDRSVKVLCRFALSENRHSGYCHEHEPLRSLFHIYLSGTHARIEARAKIINELLDSEDEHKQELGFFLLEATLKTGLFHSPYEFSFGARSRDYGYHPNTPKEITRWFDNVINICIQTALSGRPISERAKKLLADSLRGLWAVGYSFDAIEQSARKILEQGSWNEGWVAVREIIRRDNDGFEDEVRERLYRLEKTLKPSNLLEKARTFALSNPHGIFDLEEDFGEEETASARGHRTDEITRKIGVEVARDAKTLNVLLPEIVSADNRRLFHFGMGLAEGSHDRRALFEALHAALGKTLSEKRRIRVFLGFLSSCAESNPLLYNSTLDELVEDDLLGEWFPVIQEATSIIDQKGIKRLHEALDFGKAQINLFQNLGHHEEIGDDELAGLIKKILTKENGAEITLDILQSRFLGKDKSSSEYSNDLISVACDVMKASSFDESRRRNIYDYELVQVASICLDGPTGGDTAKIVCQNLKKAILENRTYPMHYPQLLDCLAKVHPIVFLDEFLKEGDVEDYQRRRIFFIDDIEGREGPLDQISDTDLQSWCISDPSSRYPLVASAIKPYKKSDQIGKYQWHPFVYTIFDKAPDLQDVLEHLADSMLPMSWSGSRADILESRAALYQDLYDYENEEVAAWANSQYAKLQGTIKRERAWENQAKLDQNESFE